MKLVEWEFFFSTLRTLSLLLVFIVMAKSKPIKVEAGTSIDESFSRYVKECRKLEKNKTKNLYDCTSVSYHLFQSIITSVTQMLFSRQQTYLMEKCFDLHQIGVGSMWISVSLRLSSNRIAVQFISFTKTTIYMISFFLCVFVWVCFVALSVRCRQCSKKNYKSLIIVSGSK